MVHAHALLHFHCILWFLSDKTVGFSEALGSVVVGHYSINGSLLNEHFNLQGGRQTNLFNADKDDKSANEAGQVPRSIYEAVIRSLSFEGNCIIVMQPLRLVCY